VIEVEKKFILTPEQEKTLIDGAEFLGEKKNIDIGYDGPNFSLTTKDIWLRQRNGKFELKLPMNESLEKRISDQYKELESDEEILAYFNTDIGQTLQDFLDKNGYEPILTIVTTRRKYKKDGFTIDLDSMDFGYNIAEIEYIAEDEKVKEATSAIIEFAKKYNIDTTSVVRGKAVEYLRRNNPKHFQALIDAKIVK